MKILSCGAGMQSTALARISCDRTRSEVKHPELPRYDAVIYCDQGNEPAWLKDRVLFLKKVCDDCEIPFYILQSNLYEDHVKILQIIRNLVYPLLR